MLTSKKGERKGEGGSGDEENKITWKRIYSIRLHTY